MPLRAVIVADQDGGIVASVYLYETPTFLFVEYLVTNPKFSMRIRYAACMWIMQALIALAATEGLILLATPRSMGAQRIIARHGFRDSGFPMWVRKRQGMQLWTAAEPEKVPSAPEEEQDPMPEPEPDESHPPGVDSLDDNDEGAPAKKAPSREVTGPTLRRRKLRVNAPAPPREDGRVSRQGRRSGLG